MKTPWPLYPYGQVIYEAFLGSLEDMYCFVLAALLISALWPSVGFLALLVLAIWIYNLGKRVSRETGAQFF